MSQQDEHFLLAPDQGCQTGVKRLEPARCGTDTENTVRLDWSGEALGLDFAEIDTLEQVADQPARASGDDDAVGSRQPL